MFASNRRHSWSLLPRSGKCSRLDFKLSSFVIIKSNKFGVSPILYRVGCVDIENILLENILELC